MGNETSCKKVELFVGEDAERRNDGGVRPLDRNTQDAIGNMLRRHYDDLVEEQIPKDIERLWKELEHRA